MVSRIEPPLFSIVMPTYESHLPWLASAIDSVIGQSFGDWELCIADDASKNREVVGLLEAYAHKEGRIKLHLRTENGHIAACSNSALEMASGRFMVLLDHDDVLPPNALEILARAIAANPQGKLFYSDEDKIDEHGAPVDEPYRKSDWDLDLFLHHNFFNHLGCFELETVRQISGFRAEYAGSQDYDLTLRMIAACGEEAIVHVPQILYHWRAIKGSVAEKMDAKPYATEAARRAIQAFLDTQFPGAVVKAHLEPAFHEVLWPLPKPLPRVALVVTRNATPVALRRLQQSIAATARYPHETIITEKPLQAAREAMADVLVFLDGNLECVDPPEYNNTGRCWLGELVAHAMRPEVGGISGKLAKPDGMLLTAGLTQRGGHFQRVYEGIRAFADFGYFGRARATHQEPYITFEMLAVRRDLWVSFAPRIVFGGAPQLQFCERAAREGYKNLVHGSVTSIFHKSYLAGEKKGAERRLRACYDRLPQGLKTLLKPFLRLPFQLYKRLRGV